jgi:hypothetical protein
LLLVIVGSSTMMIVALFLDPISVIRYDPRDQSWVLTSILSQLRTHVYATLLLIICQESGNKRCDNATQVQIFC